jgi:protein-disulfide isomerase
MAKSPDRRATAAKGMKSAAKAERRAALLRNLGIGAIGLVVAGLIAVGFMGGGGTTEEAPEGAIPTFVDQQDLWWSLNPESKAQSVLEIWEDPQCPYCAQFENAFGDLYDKLAAEDTVQVRFRPTAFLDRNFPGRHSARAINAWACAIDQNVGSNFHKVLYLSQPTVEGRGWEDSDFTTMAKTAGMPEGNIPAFEQCVADGTYYKWGVQSTDLFYELGIPGTPNLTLDGKEIPLSAVEKADPKVLEQWILDNRKS